MRRFSPDFIEQVRLANDIVDLIGEDTFLKSVGSRYMGICPFPSHNEKTPSFSVSSDSQLYHCFGCGESGNIFTYLQQRRGMHFIEAVKYLAQRAHLPLPMEKEKDIVQYQKKKQLLHVNLQVSEFYHQFLLRLPASHFVKKYLNKRKLSEKTVKLFRLGYAGSNTLVSFLNQKKLNLKLAEQLGLIRKKDNRQDYYDFFRYRLIFPVFSQNGNQVLGFGGRALDENPVKYINSIDSLVFQKGQTFYGWEQSLKTIRQQEQILIVEGYTDYLSLYQNGVQNTIATLGTALTEYHARWIARRAEQVTLCFDGDSSGQRAAVKSLNLLLSEGVAPKILILDKNQDPDTFVRKEGAESFRKKVSKSPDLFLFTLAKELKKYPIGADRLILIKKIAPVLAGIKKQVLRNYYINRFLDSFGFEEKQAKKALEQEIKNLKLKRSFQKQKTSIEKVSEKDIKAFQQVEKLSLESVSKAELYLLILSLEDMSYYETIKNSEVLKKLKHPVVISLFDQIASYDQKTSLNGFREALFSNLKDPYLLKKNNHPCLSYLTKDKIQRFIQDCINKVEKEQKRTNLKQITSDMRLDIQNPDKYLNQIAEWTKQYREPEI